MISTSRTSFGGDVVRVDELADRFDGRVRHVTGGVIFEADAGQVAVFDQRAIESLRRRAMALRRGEPLCGFEDVGAAREAARREASGLHTHGRSVARVQRFAHGAELRLQAGGLCARDAERARRGLRIEAQQVRGGCRGTEAAQCSSCVPPLCIVRSTEVASDDALRIDAGSECGEQRLRPFVVMFSERERGRRNRYGRVTVHRHVHVVVVVSMPRGAIDQRGLFDVAAAPATDQSGLRMAAEIVGFGVQNFRERFARAGQCNADEVEQALLGNGLRRGRKIVPSRG